MKKIKLMLVAFMAMVGMDALAYDLGNGAGVAVTFTQNGIQYKILTVYNTETETKVNTVSAIQNNFTATTITIENTVTADVEGTDDDGVAIKKAATFRVVEIQEEGFKDLTKVTSASIGKYVTTIGANAFNGCAKLATVTFAEGSELTTIGNYAFGTTPSLTSISFANCAKLIAFTEDGTTATIDGSKDVLPFIPGAGSANNELASITLPAGKTKYIGAALANLKALATITNLDAITVLNANSFANDNALTSLEIPATCATIASSALASSKVATLTINSLEATPQDIKTTVYGTTDVLTAVEFKGVFKGDIAAGAFGITKLTSVKFAEAKAKKTATAIAAGAFVLADAASTVEIAKISAADVFTASAFTGPATATNKVTLNLGIVAAQPAMLVSKNVGTATITQVSADFSVDALGDAQTIIFTAIDEGKKLAAATAAVKATKVVFGTEETGCALDAGAVPDDAFMSATGLKIYWKPATATAAFSTKMIQAATGGTYGTTEANTAMKNFLYTTTGVAEKYETPFTGTVEKIFNVFIVAEATAAETTEIEVGKASGDWSYGKHFSTGKTRIAKAQKSGAKAIVYGAYVDQKDNATIYMEQLRVIDGFYYVPANVPVIVKSSTSDPVIAEGTSETKSGMNWKDATHYVNEIAYLAAETVGTTLMNKANDNDYTVIAGATATVNNPDYDLYAMAKPSKWNMSWKKFGASTTLPKGTFYIRCAKSDAARLNVIWLDGSEEDQVTAIKAVKTAAEKGAIYNLAGQKVNASYKGVVIKDGKKFIQK